MWASNFADYCKGIGNCCEYEDGCFVQLDSLITWLNWLILKLWPNGMPVMRVSAQIWITVRTFLKSASLVLGLYITSLQAGIMQSGNLGLNCWLAGRFKRVIRNEHRKIMLTCCQSQLWEEVMCEHAVVAEMTAVSNGSCVTGPWEMESKRSICYNVNNDPSFHCAARDNLLQIHPIPSSPSAADTMWRQERKKSIEGKYEGLNAKAQSKTF